MSARHRTAGLAARLDGLTEAVDALAEFDCELLGDSDALERARDVLARVGARRALSGEHTVIALAGATGSGKSSVFNALAGAETARVGARRPTTAHPLAITWGPDEGAGALLDWLSVEGRHQVPATSGGIDLTGLILLDLPDVDSVKVDHHQRAARLAETVDVLIWVLDPQKYADAVVHQQYLRPMARHAEVTLVLLNQVDLLADSDRAAVLSDLRARLRQDGMGQAQVLTGSATTGEGIEDLREQIAAVVRTRRAAEVRLCADVARAADDLAHAYPAPEEAAVSAPDRRRLTATLARAAGVDLVTDAVAGSYRHRARARTGWPLTRWLARLRADPLRRLHLAGPAHQRRETDEDAPVVAVSALPKASAVQRAKLSTALRQVGADAAADTAEPWRSYLRAAPLSAADKLPDELDQAIVSTVIPGRADPVWFRAVGALQWLAFAVLIVGAGWLGVLAAMGYLRLPVTWVPQIGPVPANPPLPELPAIPWPTALLVLGLVFGLLIALTSRIAAAIGARRHARRARAVLIRAVDERTSALVLAPLTLRLAHASHYRAGISAARR